VCRSSHLCRSALICARRALQVTTLGGVQEYTQVTFETDLGVYCNPVVPGVPDSFTMSLFSVAAGFTSWSVTMRRLMRGTTLRRVGMKQICLPKAGETVVVSGAAGSVGSIAGQLAKAAGARVIGIAGTADKVCQRLALAVA
jgi:NADPH:quinone reductase-like Zn-dependent oxidoreductase